MPMTAPFVYEGESTREISFPLGGIGTGSIGLSGAGRLIDWEILNRPAKGITNGLSHFAVRAEQDGRVLDARILNGPYLGNRTGDFPADTSRNFGFGARRDSLAGMPHFPANTFEGRFPVAQLTFDSPTFPGAVGLTAFNPFIPLNDRDSSIPVAMFEIAFTNPTDAPITYTAVGVVGHGLQPPTKATRVNRKGVTGVKVITDEPDTSAPHYAEIVLATDSPVTSRQTHLYRGHWFDALEVYWKELNQPGAFTDRDYGTADVAGGMGRNRDSSLVAGHVIVAPGETKSVRFAITWYAPNFRKYWITPVWHFRNPSPASGQWKNWYATEWTGAETIAKEVFDRWSVLRDETFAFRDAVYGSTIPLSILDAAGANLSILKSPTTVRLEDGTFYGWEGCHPAAGSCEGSCTHVWNYQQALPHLFPAIERTLRETEFTYNMLPSGGLTFRQKLPLGSGFDIIGPCADGHFGAIIKTYRDWKLSGDTEWLRRYWPKVKRALEYAWSPDNPDRWDPDQTGILSGRQHHTLDMELFGPNSWLGSMYVAALLAASEMARTVGESEFADKTAQMGAAGARYIDTELYNGRWFFQKIDLEDKSLLAPFDTGRNAGVLADPFLDVYWSDEFGEIKYQMGEGCISDQILGQWHAEVAGLGQFLTPDKVRAALASVFRENFRETLADHFNPCRNYAYEDEGGLLLASYPGGVRQPMVAAPYAEEVWTGIEYMAASHMIMNGLVEEGLAIVRAARDRHDGSRRNPWNDIECGSYYARSMSAWQLVNAISGLSADFVAGELRFDPKVEGDCRLFWSAGTAFGTLTRNGKAISLAVVGGRLKAKRLVVAGENFELPGDLASGESIDFTVS